MHGLKSIPGLSGNQCDIQVSLENLYIKPRQTKQNVTLNSGAWQISTNMGDGPGAQRWKWLVWLPEGNPTEAEPGWQRFHVRSCSTPGLTHLCSLKSGKWILCVSDA